MKNPFRIICRLMGGHTWVYSRMRTGETGEKDGVTEYEWNDIRICSVCKRRELADEWWGDEWGKER